MICDELRRLRATYRHLEGVLHEAQQKRRLPLETRADALGQLVGSLEMLIALEHRAYGIDARPGAKLTRKAMLEFAGLLEIIDKTLLAGGSEARHGTA